jgi:hypothetical protein
MTISTPNEVVESYPHDLYSVQSNDNYQLLNDLHEYPGRKSANAFGQSVHLAFANGSAAPENLRSFLQEKGHGAVTIEKILPNIEDCFIELMGNPL